jgi:uncharacterized repeat protein (TIGR01451 family)
MKAKFLKLIPLFFAFFIGIVLSSAALGAGETKDKLKLKVEGYIVKVVVDDKGKREELQPLPKKVYPGDVIEYKVIATNTSNEELKNIIIRAKIPEGTVYVPKSASGEPEFSIDNGKTFSKEPVKYYVIENGKKVEKIATPDMYTNLRWKIDVLKPNETAEFYYRVRVKS